MDGPKFLECIDNQIFTMVLRCARVGRLRAPLQPYNIIIFIIIFCYLLSALLSQNTLIIDSVKSSMATFHTSKCQDTGNIKVLKI